MRRFARTDGTHIDLAAVDVLRSRERGVPRYAEFRRQMHMTPVRSFDDFAVDFTPEVYTPEGLRWIDDTTNASAPWVRTG